MRHKKGTPDVVIITKDTANLYHLIESGVPLRDVGLKGELGHRRGAVALMNLRKRGGERWGWVDVYRKGMAPANKFGLSWGGLVDSPGVQQLEELHRASSCGC